MPANGTRSSSRRKGGGAAMTSGAKRATRNSGIAVDVNLWDLRDLPKTSTVKRAPKLKLKNYTVKLPRASRDQDMKLLRRAARDNEGVGESDPVYPLTRPACITRGEAAVALLALGDERDDATVAAAKPAAVSESGDGDAGARSTIADGSMPIVKGINQPLLAEAEADYDLASPVASRNLTTEDQRSSLLHPAQLHHALGKPYSSNDTTGAMSAAAKVTTATRAGDVTGLAATTAAKVLSHGAAAGKPVLKGGLATVVAYDIGSSMDVAGGRDIAVSVPIEPSAAGDEGSGGSGSEPGSSRFGGGGGGGVAGGGVGGEQGPRLEPEHDVGGSASSNKYKLVIGDGDVHEDSPMVDQLSKIACVWGSSTGQREQGGAGGGKAGAGCYKNGGEASGGHTTKRSEAEHAESDGAHTSGSGGYSGGYVGATTSDDNDSSGGGSDGNGFMMTSSSSSSSSSGGHVGCSGVLPHKSRGDEGEGCDGSSSASSPSQPSRDSCLGKQKRENTDDDGGGAADVMRKRVKTGGRYCSYGGGGGGGGSGVTTSDGNDSSSSSSSNSGGGGIAWDNTTDNAGGCDASSSEPSPPSPSRDSSTFGKRKRGHVDNDDGDMVDGSGCVDVNTGGGDDDGDGERCAKRARQAAGGQSRQLRGSRDRSGK